MGKKLLSLLLMVSMLTSFLVGVIPSAAAAPAENTPAAAPTTTTITGSADPVTTVGSLPSDAPAGGFYADKSVTYNEKTEDFTAVLSAVSKDYQKNVKDEDLIPLDIVVIVDSSASMADKVVTSDSEKQDWTRTQYLAWGMNSIIDRVIEGKNNRLGIVTFSGKDTVGDSPNNAQVFLPLGSYDKVDLTVDKADYNLDDDTTKDLITTDRLNISYLPSTGSYPYTHTDNVLMRGGTFTQTGVAKAYDMLYANTDRTVNIQGADYYRIPIVVLITDGQPTLACNAYNNITASTQSDVGDGSTVTDIDQAYTAYNTMYSCAYYGNLMSRLYSQDGNSVSPNYRFMTVGIGVDNLDNVSSSFAAAFLDPSRENVNALKGDSAYYANIKDSDGHSKNFSADLNYYLTHGQTQAGDIVEVEYDGSLDYATDYYPVSNANTGEGLKQAFDDIASIHVTTTEDEYYSPMDFEGMVTFTDTLGEGMELSSRPTLSYGGKAYYPTKTGSGDNVTYHYSGTVRVLNSPDFINITEELSQASVTVTRDAQGRQVLTWSLPGKLVPSYSYYIAKHSYVPIEPVKLSYDIRPVSRVIDTPTATLYTNSTDAPTTVEYDFSMNSAYYNQKFGDDNHSKTLSGLKQTNPTGTNDYVYTVTADETANPGGVFAHMTATLGNNGKAVLTQETVPSDANGTADIPTVLSGVSPNAAPGSVFTDKTVGYNPENQNFTATLSAVAKDYHEEIDSSVQIPMDVVVILDISGSMNTLLGGSTDTRMKQVAQQMNTLCASVIQASPDTRIGVVTYSGASLEVGPTGSNAAELIPLGNYTGIRLDYTYDSAANTGSLKAYLNGRSYEEGSVNVVGGTYTQTGIANAYEMLENAPGKTFTASNGKSYDRTPVVVLVTDGEPTWATSAYTNPMAGQSEFGDGSIGFVLDDTTGKPKDDPVDVSLDKIAYYTILTGQHFAGKMKKLYNDNPSSLFMTVGVGINDMNVAADGVDSCFLNTVLNPTPENIDGLVGPDSSVVPDKYFDYAVRLKALLSGTDTEYSGASYADLYFNVADPDISGIASALLSALQHSEENYTYKSALQPGTDMVFTDTIGAGMEIISAPVLTYNGRAYQPVKAGDTYTYTGSVRPTAGNVSIPLDGMKAEIITNTDGQQKLTWTIPEKLVPSYIYVRAKKDFRPVTPVFLSYNVAPTAEKRDSGEVLYTNDWADHKTTAAFKVTEESPYVTTGAINDVPFVVKGANTTETNPNRNETVVSGSDVTVTLGNNGKWVNKVEKPALGVLHVDTRWYNPDGTEIPNSDETTTVYLYRYKTDGQGSIEGDVEIADTKTFGPGNWSGDFTKLPFVDETGNPYKYCVSQLISGDVLNEKYTTTYQLDSGSEDEFCPYTSVTDGRFTIYNRQKAPASMDLTVKKVWADNTGSTQNDITVTLYKADTADSTGTAAETVTFGQAEGWQHIFTGLDTNFYYYAVETPVSGYDASYSGRVSKDTAEKKITVTNTPEPATGITVEKNWLDAQGQPMTDLSRAPEVSVDLIQVDHYEAPSENPEPSTEPEPPTEPPTEPEPDPEPTAKHTVTFVFNQKFDDYSDPESACTSNPYAIEVDEGSTAKLTVNEATGLRVFSDSNTSLSCETEPQATVVNNLQISKARRDSDYSYRVSMTGDIAVTNVTADVTVTVTLIDTWAGGERFETFDVTTEQVNAPTKSVKATKAAGAMHTVTFEIHGVSGGQEYNCLPVNSGDAITVPNMEDGKDLTLTFTNASGLQLWCLDKPYTMTIVVPEGVDVDYTGVTGILDTAQSSSSPLLTISGPITVKNVTSDLTIKILIDEIYTAYSKFAKFEYTTEITGGAVPLVPVTEEKVYQAVTLSQENGWKFSFPELPVSETIDGVEHTYSYYAKEKNGETYHAAYENNDGITEGTIKITNKLPLGSVPDTVVMDYGLPIDIHVLVNDHFGASGTLAGIGACPASMSVTDTIRPKVNHQNYKGSFGSAKIVGDAVVYTPSNMQMTEPEVFAYAVKYTADRTTQYFYDTVTVVPATAVYYEDSFVKFDGGWTTAGDDRLAGSHQAEDRPGTFEFPDYDADNVYGHDQAYDNCTTYSLGSAQKVTVDGNTWNTDGKWPTATFTFTGTGFDLISLTSNTTGYIGCWVYEGTEAAGSPLHRWSVNTYYGYTRTVDETNPWVKYTWTWNGERWTGVKECVTKKGNDDSPTLPANPEKGDTCIQYKENYIWTKDNSENNSLYQIPVIKSPELAYGTYTVVVTPTYVPFFDKTGDGQYDFYLDAVRVYSPAQNLDGTYYVQDNEAWPQYIELRKLLLTKDESNQATGFVNGVSFIDGVSGGNVADYEEFGPNNEIYLNSRQAIAFAIDSKGNSIADVQVGIKTFNNAGSLRISAVDAANPSGDALAEGSLSINSHTDMYYSLKQGLDCVLWPTGKNVSHAVVLTNLGTTPVTLTSLKITYTAKPSTDSELVMNKALMEAAGQHATRSIAGMQVSCHHKFENAVTTVPTETEEGILTQTCRDCGATRTEVLPVLTDEAYEITSEKAPTCVDSGERVYYLAEYDVSFSVELSPLGHDLIVDPGKAPTCTEPGLTAGCHCSRCDYREPQEVIPATGHHFESTVTTVPTDTEEGLLTQTCRDCGATRTEVLPVLTDEAYEITSEKAPTCVDSGERVYYLAEHDVSFTVKLSPLGHDLIVDPAVAPTCTEPGLTAGCHCSRCDYREPQEVIPATGHHFENGVCTDCGAIDPNAEHITDSYTDIPAKDNWAYAGIDYVLTHGMMNGTDTNIFEPEGTMTRAMAVTVLWRMAGSPKAENAKVFADVPVNEWFTEAAAWAHKEGIARGMENNLFCPMGEVTREAFAVFLFRFDKAEKEPIGSLSRFDDAEKVSSWAVDAVSWAEAEKILQGGQEGDQLLLTPQEPVTRAQAAAMLMRFLEGKEA